MHYRAIQDKDFEQIEKIYQTYHAQDFVYDFKDVSFTGVAVDDNDNVVALSIIKPIYEAIMILDTGRPVRDKVNALESLVSNGMFECARRGIEQVHAFVQSTSFIKLLLKQFGFKTAKGEAIVKII
jgi:hypothetical protein